jgi:hypothetical protein
MVSDGGSRGPFARRKAPRRLLPSRIKRHRPANLREGHQSPLQRAPNIVATDSPLQAPVWLLPAAFDLVAFMAVRTGLSKGREGASKGARKEAAAASRTATIQVARTTAGRHRERGALAPLRLDEGSPPKGAGSRRCRVPQGPAEEPKAGVVGCFH